MAPFIITLIGSRKKIRTCQWYLSGCLGLIYPYYTILQDLTNLYSGFVFYLALLPRQICQADLLNLRVTSSRERCRGNLLRAFTHLTVLASELARANPATLSATRSTAYTPSLVASVRICDPGRDPSSSRVLSPAVCDSRHPRSSLKSICFVAWRQCLGMPNA